MQTHRLCFNAAVDDLAVRKHGPDAAGEVDDV
jgi:hypothetical protein